MMIRSWVLVGIFLPFLKIASAWALDLPNPFRELEKQATTIDQSDARALFELSRLAEEKGLPGRARYWARLALKRAPDFKEAHHYLGHRQSMDPKSHELRWTSEYVAKKWAVGLYKSLDLGWVTEEKPDDLLRALQPEGGGWDSALEVTSVYFRVKSTLPKAVLWYIADDLDRFAQAYMDHFELRPLPTNDEPKLICQAYATLADAKAAGANVEALDKYGAYYSTSAGVLHVMFHSVGGLTAIRHEAAHALNRLFIRENVLSQWIDEGIGVYGQFAIPDATHIFTFGKFPDHGFATEFFNNARRGKTESLRSISNAIFQTPYVVTNAYYYSKFRAMLDFFMNSHDRKYRWSFLQALFHDRGFIHLFFWNDAVENDWQAYLLKPTVDPDWHYVGDVKRARRLRLIN